MSFSASIEPLTQWWIKFLDINLFFMSHDNIQTSNTDHNFNKVKETNNCAVTEMPPHLKTMLAMDPLNLI